MCVGQPPMASSRSTDYIFVEVNADEQEGSISRGTKISHALRRHHREARKERARKHLATSYPVHPSRQPGGRQLLPFRGRPSPTPDLAQKPSTPTDRDLSQKKPDPRRACELGILQPLALKVALGQGRLDPFNVYPADHVCLYVHEILDHAVNYTWPGVSPFAPSSSNPVKRAWLGCAMANPVAFYSCVFAAGLHHAYKHGWDNTPPKAYDLLFSYKTKAISLVNEALQNLDVDISDALLFSILILAAHGPRETSLEHDESPSPPTQHIPSSPLATAQNIDFYGSLTFDHLHMNALRLLVVRRGGLQKIQLYSLAETIAAGEILGSTKTLAQPVLPEDAFNCPTTILSPALDLSYEVGGVTFPALSYRATFKDLLRVLRDMAVLCCALDDYTTSTSTSFRTIISEDDDHDDQASTCDDSPKYEPPISIGDLLRTRNVLQHRLLSLPQRQFMLARDHAIYEACRLAALAFSDMVLFPLPKVTSVRPHITGMLRRAMEKWMSLRQDIKPDEDDDADDEEQRALAEKEDQLLLWITTMGALAAATSVKEEIRTWFSEALSRCSARLGITQWTDARRILKRHLWYDGVCDSPGQAVWEEAYNSTYIEWSLHDDVAW